MRKPCGKRGKYRSNLPQSSIDPQIAAKLWVYRWKHKRHPMTQDEDQLRLLSIFHYVVGGIAGLFALLPIFHLVFGLFFIFAPEKFEGNGQPPPAFIGWIFVIFAALFITIGWVFAAFV